VTERNEPEALSCAAAREWIHRVLDGELMEACHRQRLQDHVEVCAACREEQAELRSIQEELRALPPVPLPGAALQEVWRWTSRAEAPTAPSRGRLLDWRAAAAAVVLAATLGGLARWLPAPSTEPTAEEVARARYVLALTAEALRTTRRVAVDEVLADEVSPALDSVPLKLPGSRAESSRRDRT
jgi:anti-sigma factor RsiW